MNAKEQVFQLADAINGLTPSQRTWMCSFVQQFGMGHQFDVNPASDLVTVNVLEHIGDLLRIHHAMSRQNLSKAPFEYAFEKALQLSGVSAKLADSATNPGYDITVNGARISLKTEGSKSIKVDRLLVSKWMEMGKGEWNPPTLQLHQFLAHLNNYDRILSLRCLDKKNGQYWYELVEIPKKLMLEAANGVMEQALATKQLTFPWRCHVLDNYGEEMYHLYFDAGGERKLQVKAILKKHCTVHATWRFNSKQLQPIEDTPVEE